MSINHQKKGLFFISPLAKIKRRSDLLAPWNLIKQSDNLFVAPLIFKADSALKAVRNNSLIAAPPCAH